MRLEAHFSLRRGTPNSILIYRPGDFSFDTDPAPSDAFTSALFDDLSLELNADGRIVSIWGMCPHSRWQVSELAPPDAKPGDVLVVADSPLTRGASFRINEKRWMPVLVDPLSGWICVKGEGKAATSVKIFPGVIIQITDDEGLCALWLKPESLPALR